MIPTGSRPRILKEPLQAIFTGGLLVKQMKNSVLSNLELSDRYATNRNDLVGEFYTPCLNKAISYDRAVGFFRSSAFLLAIKPIANFAIRGGHIRIICSPRLIEDDIIAIDQGYSQREILLKAIMRSIEETIQESTSRNVMEFFATLISIRSLDIKIAFRPGARGFFHDKIGIFKDIEGNSITFIGSSNETKFGWDLQGNHESFDVFRSWTSEQHRVTSHIQYFERLWNGEEPGVEVQLFPEVAHEKLIAISNTEGIEAAFNKVKDRERQAIKIPLPHQLEVIESWRKNDRRGIIDHATGSGKTFTAVIAIKEMLDRGMPVLIIVPSEILLHQWRKELKQEIGDHSMRLLLAGAGNTRWTMADIVEGFSGPDGGARIILATIQTAASIDFLSRVIEGDHIFIVVDEVHRIGSRENSKILNLQAGPRLGLSATPQRYGDPEGTKKIFQFFGDILQPSFTLEDAIHAGRLCQYTYDVHAIHLTEAEIEDWLTYTEKIKKQYGKLPRTSEGDPIYSDYIKVLLYQRARIIKGAENKVKLAKNILIENYEPDHRWLVYCDTQDQLNEVRRELLDEGLPVDEYHYQMLGDRGATLDYFFYKSGILVAIKCLDEGVDIPAVDHALILASSKNPREFIQRRGRVLRSYPGKHFAQIHDALVLPPPGDSDSAQVSMLEGELGRAIHFSMLASNEAVKFKLRKIAREYGINPDSVLQSGNMEDEEIIE